MDKLKRPAIWVPLAVIGGVLLIAAGAAGAYFALKPTSTTDGSGTTGFIAHGTVLATSPGIDGFTPAARRCVITTLSGAVVQQGTPVTIALDDEVVGAGELPIGTYKPNPPTGASCVFEFTVNVSKAVPGGKYKVSVAGMTASKTLDELKTGKFALAP